MNYAWDNQVVHYRFSDQEAMIRLNPSHVSETNSYPGMTTSLLSGAPYFLGTDSDSVDWNLSGSFGSASAQYSAPLRLAQNSSCRTFSEGRQAIWSNNYIVGATDLVRVGDRMYAFFAGASDAEAESGAVAYAFATLGQPATASCTGPDNPLEYDPADAESATTGCLAWSGPWALGFDAAGVSAAWWQGSVFLASLSPTNGLDMRRFTVGSNGWLTAAGTQSVASGTNRGRPELAVMYASPLAGAGWTQRLVVVRNDPSNSGYRAYYWTGSTFSFWSDFRLAENADGSADNLTGAGDAALVAWPDPFNTSVDAEDRITCGIFPNEDRGMRPYCFDPVDLVWRDLTDQVFSAQATSGCNAGSEVLDSEAGLSGRCLVVSATAPQLAMRYVRRDTGLPLSLGSATSHFQLTWSFDTPGSPRVWISEPLSTLNHPSEGAWAFGNWRDFFANTWHIADAGSNVPMYEDSAMGGMFALDTRLQIVRFYPHADGSADVDLWVGSDFRVIEDHLCRWVAGDPVVVCGEINVFE
jgi:hypothetical protein